MNIGKILLELRQELETLNDAIESLERLQRVGPRRGRPRTREPLAGERAAETAAKREKNGGTALRVR